MSLRPLIHTKIHVIPILRLLHIMTYLCISKLLMFLISVHSSDITRRSPHHRIARFLFEFHAVLFERLDLPRLLPADRSDFDVHGALEDDKVKAEIMLCIMHIMYS